MVAYSWEKTEKKKKKKKKEKEMRDSKKERKKERNQCWAERAMQPGTPAVKTSNHMRRSKKDSCESRYSTY